MYRILILLLFLGIVGFAPQQVDSVVLRARTIDSLDSARTQSIISKRDTVAPVLLRARDSIQIALYSDSLKKNFWQPFLYLQESLRNYRHAEHVIKYQQGNLISRGEGWIIATIAFLLVFFAFLKTIFDKQLTAIVQSFFSNRVLSNINREENLFTSWPFFLLFVHFGFTIGLFFYLAAKHEDVNFAKDGFQVFVTISIGIIALYVLKIVVLRLLGYFFNVQKPINEYISILYLTYFNASLLFMPLVIAFALSPPHYGKFYMATSVVLLVIIFALQLIRAGINILSQNRFSKVYLFLYFCTLEICPILILIKAIGF
ncbi:DUF4271 domain-containing protein [Pedobacter sp. Du54]|uniref:DUF4271 domain-containing protein n=1 Tax=Pedobacter anseongensis TaxID=3133439 RepID=UPI0030B417BA